MSNVWHRIPCCRSKLELKHGKGGLKEEIEETRFIAKFNITDTSNPTKIAANGQISYGPPISTNIEDNFSKMEVDGITLDNVVSAYTFDTVGKHTVKYILKDATTIGFASFYDCSNLVSINIPNSVTSISNYAFHGCNSLTSVKIPNNITSIGENAFDGCSLIQKVIVLDIVTWLNISFGSYSANPLDYAHHLYSDENTEITDLVIPNSVTGIGNYTFSGCSGLTSVTIPNTVTSIGSGAFAQCSSLTSVTIPNSVTSIGSSAFYKCSSLTSVTISNSVTSIGSSAFSDCTSLTSIILPNSVTSIGGSAFNGLSLTSIIIPESLTSIGYGCFSSCSNLESVTVLPTTPPSMIGGSYLGRIFNNTSVNLVIYVPAESVDAYKAAEGWRDYANRIQAIQ